MPTPSRVFINKDLHSQAMPVNEQEDDFIPDSDDFQSDAEDDFIPDSTESQVPSAQMSTVSNEEPDTFASGFMNSILSGEAGDVSTKSMQGFLKGAVLDIPSSIWGGIKSVGNLIANPKETISSIPEGLKEMASGMYDTTMRAGSEPEAFGRMAGQLTGQPLATAGLVKAMPAATRMTGAVIEPTGRFMRKHTPLTGMPIISPLAGRNLMKLERATGRGLESVGQRMKQVGKTADSIDVETPPSANKPIKNLIEQIDAPEVELSRNSTLFNKNKSPKSTQVEGEFPFPDKPEIMLTKDGSYINLKTGEIVDSPSSQLSKPPIREDIGIKPDIMDLHPIDGANRIIKEGKKLLNKDYPNEAPTQYHPKPDWPEGTKKQRLYELMDKSNAGTLTMDELVEARVLDKQLRNHDINPINPNLPGPMGKTYEPKPRKMTVINDTATDALREVRMAKRSLRANTDGTFTDTKTGELLNDKGQTILKIDGKPIKPKS